MSRLASPLTFFFLLLPVASPAINKQEPEAPVIGKIEIVVNNVFEEEGPGGLTWAYRLGNKIHIRTREEVIRRELLFASGEPLNPEALAQTERNLRSLAFLRDAKVETEEGENGTVDVRVETFDSWSTIAQIRFAKVGNELVWTLGAAERNFLGRGKWIELTRRSDIDRDRTELLYHDPRLFGSRLQTLASYADQSDGSSGQFVLSRPFFALSTGWAFSGGLQAFDQLDPLFAFGERVDSLRHVRRWGDIEFARAFFRSDARAGRLHVAYRAHEDEVEGDLRDFGTLEVGVSTVEHRFLKLTHVNRFEIAEDFNLGNEASAFAGVSTPALGGEDGTVWFWRLQARRGFQFGAGHFTTGGAAWTARHRHGEVQNSLTSIRLDYVNKFLPRWPLVATAQFRSGGNLDPEVQITLGADNGLRGYPVRQFVGTRAVLLSAEQRVFIADEVLQLVSFAAAVFVDSGFAWPEGRSIRLGDLKSDVGLSLLLGRARLSSTTPGVRLDLAYALDPIVGRSRWLFSVGSKIEL
jgi:hypothetical protein